MASDEPPGESEKLAEDEQPSDKEPEPVVEQLQENLNAASVNSMALAGSEEGRPRYEENPIPIYCIDLSLPPAERYVGPPQITSFSPLSSQSSRKNHKNLDME